MEESFEGQGLGLVILEAGASAAVVDSVVVGGVFAKADPAKLCLAFFASHMIAAVHFLDGRQTVRAFSTLKD